MAADALAFGEPPADLDHLGDDAPAEPTDFVGVLGQDGIADGSLDAASRAARPGWILNCSHGKPPKKEAASKRPPIASRCCRCCRRARIAGCRRQRILLRRPASAL